MSVTMSPTQHERDQERKDGLRAEAIGVRIQAVAFARDIHRGVATHFDGRSDEEVAAEIIDLAALYESFLIDGTLPDIEGVAK